MSSSGVDASNDQIGSNMALVTEKVLFEKGHAGDDAGFATRGEGMQLELGGDKGCSELSIGGGTRTSTPDLWRDVMELLAVLVGDDGAACGSGIGSDLGNGVRVGAA